MAYFMLRTLQYVEGDTISAPGKDEKLCVPESRRTSIPNGEMVELASHVRVQKKKKGRKEESANCKPNWGVSTSKDASMDRLVRTYLSSREESGLTMRDSHRSLTDRQISDSPPNSDIADVLGSQIVVRSDQTRSFNSYNSQV